MSEIKWGSDGSATLALGGDASPLEKSLSEALSALDRFVKQATKGLDAFDLKVDASFEKFASTARAAFADFKDAAAEAVAAFGASTSTIAADIAPMTSAARELGAASERPTEPDDGAARPSLPVVDVSLFSEAFNSAAIESVKAFGKTALDAFVTFGDSMDKMSGRTGFAVETLSAFSHVAGQCGTSIETVEAAIRGATNVLGQAANGSKDAAAKFERLGLNVADLLKSSPEKQFKALLKALAAVENPTLRAAAAMEIMGDAGSQLGPMINGGAEALDAYLEEAKAAGVVMSGDAAASAAALNDALGRLKTSFKGLSLAAAESLVPAAQAVVDFGTKAIQAATQITRDFPGITKAVEMFGGAVLATFGTAYAIQRVAAYGEAFRAFAVTVNSSLAAIATNPVIMAGVAIAAVAGIANAAYNAMEYTAQISDEAKKATVAADELRRASEAKLEAVLIAADAPELTAEEFDKAAGYVDELTVSYGDLGIEVDRTTGKIIAAADAQERFAEAARRQAINDLKKEIAEGEKNLSEAQKEEDAAVKQIDSGASRLVYAPRALGNLIAPEYVDSVSDVVGAKIDAAGQKKLDAQQQLTDARKRLAALEGGDAAAIYGVAPKVEGDSTAEAERAKQAAELDATLEKYERDARRRSQTTLQNKIEDIEAETAAREKALNDRIALEKKKPESERDAALIADLETKLTQAQIDGANRLAEARAEAAERRQAELDRIADAESKLNDEEKSALAQKTEAIDREIEAYKKLLETAIKTAETEEERAALTEKLNAADNLADERKNAEYQKIIDAGPTAADREETKRQTELGDLYAKQARGEGTEEDAARIAELKSQMAEEANNVAASALDEAKTALDAALESLEEAEIWGDAEEIAKATEEYNAAKKEYDAAFSDVERLSKSVDGQSPGEFKDEIADATKEAKIKFSSSGASFSAFDVQKLGANAVGDAATEEAKKTNELLDGIKSLLEDGDFSARCGD